MILNTFCTTPRLLTDILNNEKFQNVMFDLYERYLDEGNHEYLINYDSAIEQVLLEILNNGNTKSNVKTIALNLTREPFGFKYKSYYMGTHNGIIKVGTIEVQFMIKNGKEISYELTNFDKY